MSTVDMGGVYPALLFIAMKKMTTELRRESGTLDFRS